MDAWKSRGGKSHGGEAKKGEDQRRERVRRKKMQVLEKVGKSQFTVFLGTEPSGQMRDEELHAVVARSTCPSPNVENKRRTAFSS